MDKRKFSPQRTGRLVSIAGSAAAFVPDPLPPALNLTWQLSSRLSDADRAIGTLVGIGRILPNPHILTQPFIRREAVLSSRIEGTQASLSDLVAFEAGAPEPERSDVREVANYVTALQHGLERLQELPLSLRFLRELHEKLMSDVRGANRQPGEFRTIQNWIGAAGCEIEDATYVPPPVPLMHEALDAFEKYLHAKSDIPALIRAALIHYQFEAIHPFLDGNGRIGRLLVFFVLHLERVLDEPLLYLSAFFERNREEYYGRLFNVSAYGAWNEWIDFFLRGVAEQAKDAVRRTRELLDVTSEYKMRVAKARNAGALARVIDELLERPVITVSRLSELLNVSYPAAKKSMDTLVRHNIVRAGLTIRNRTYYVNTRVLEILT